MDIEKRLEELTIEHKELLLQLFNPLQRLSALEAQIKLLSEIKDSENKEIVEDKE
jgi:hypothetical protein